MTSIDGRKFNKNVPKENLEESFDSDEEEESSTDPIKSRFDYSKIFQIPEELKTPR